MKFLGPIALVLAVVLLLMVAAGGGIHRRDGQDLSWRDGLVLFGAYVAIVFTTCVVIDAITAAVHAWRT